MNRKSANKLRKEAAERWIKNNRHLLDIHPDDELQVMDSGSVISSRSKCSIGAIVCDIKLEEFIFIKN